ncbi:MAG TPA: hypothetical protein PK264_05240 [Hyphomicrobiaceae bacterium]|nr:hypothetical protein [Hyphomicrobiaceae bacterium]
MFGEIAGPVEFWTRADFTEAELANDSRLRGYGNRLLGSDYNHWEQFPKFSPEEIARRRLEMVQAAMRAGHTEFAMMILNGPDKLPQFRARWIRGLWPVPGGPWGAPKFWEKYL